MKNLSSFTNKISNNDIKIFYDGIDIQKYTNNDEITGFTTNPSLLKSITTKNYYELSKNMLLFTNNVKYSNILL